MTETSRNNRDRHARIEHLGSNEMAEIMEAEVVESSRLRTRMNLFVTKFEPSTETIFVCAEDESIADLFQHSSRYLAVIHSQ